MVEGQIVTTVRIAISPDEDDSVKALVQEADRLLEYANGLVITSDEGVRVATEDLSFLVKLKKALEDKRGEYVKPINTILKGINDTFKAIVTPVETADKLIRDKILAYRREQDRKAREIEEINWLRMEAARLEAKLNEGEITEPIAIVEKPPAPLLTVRTEVGTLGTMKVWQFEIIDFSLLPDQYKLPDMVKIRKVITAGATIAGVRSWQEESLRVTTK